MQCWIGKFQKTGNFVDRNVILSKVFFRKSIFMFRKDELNNITVYSMSNVYISDPFAQLEVPKVACVFKVLSLVGDTEMNNNTSLCTRGQKSGVRGKWIRQGATSQK